MGTEYIEKQVAMDAVNSVPAANWVSKRYTEELERIPPADVQPVRRGRWEMDSDGIPHCTECGYLAPQRLFLQVQSLACTTRFIMSNFCPDCGSYNGADMRGGDAE